MVHRKSIIGAHDIRERSRNNTHMRFFKQSLTAFKRGIRLKAVSDPFSFFVIQMSALPIVVKRQFLA